MPFTESHGFLGGDTPKSFFFLKIGDRSILFIFVAKISRLSPALACLRISVFQARSFRVGETTSLETWRFWLDEGKFDRKKWKISSKNDGNL